jgi:hypothetical protein
LFEITDDSRTVVIIVASSTFQIDCDARAVVIVVTKNISN